MSHCTCDKAEEVKKLQKKIALFRRLLKSAADSLLYWHNKGTMGDLPCSGWDAGCGTCPQLAQIDRELKRK